MADSKDNNKESDTNQSMIPYILKMLFLTSGIYISFSLNGIFLENLLLKKFELFYTTQIFISYLLSMTIALIACKVTGESTTSKIPIKDSIEFSLLLVIGQGLSVFGFSNVSYFIGNLVKSSKTISTVLFAVLMRDWVYLRKLSRNTWIAIIMITAGIISFNIFADSTKKEKSSEIIGFVSIFSALFVESYVNNIQRKTIEEIKPSSLDFMLSIAKFSTLISLVISVVTFDLFNAAVYWHGNPKAFMFILGYTMSAASGQLFIFSMLNNYGPIKLTMVTSSRKMLSVVLSILIFHHPMNKIQVVAIISIIFAMGMELIEGAKQNKKKTVKEKTD